MNHVRSFDFLKFILSFFVIAIHCYTAPHLVLLDVAVPLYFMMSGFLLYNKAIHSVTALEKVSSCDKYVKHIFKLYITWSLIYLPYTIYGFYALDGSYMGKLLCIIRGFLLVGENYLSWPLWYLLGLVVSVLIIRTFINCSKFTLNQLFLVSVLFLITGMVLNRSIDSPILPIKVISKVYFSVFATTRNGVFCGFPLVMLGMMIAKYSTFATNTRTIVVGGGILLALICLQYMGVGVPFLIYLCSAWILLFFIKIGVTFGKNDIFLRKMSLMIFLVHMIPVGLFTIFLPEINRHILFIVSSILSYILAYIILKLSYKYKCISIIM